MTQEIVQKQKQVLYTNIGRMVQVSQSKGCWLGTRYRFRYLDSYGNKKL